MGPGLARFHVRLRRDGRVGVVGHDEGGTRLGPPRISACRPSRPAGGGPERDELDGPVQEQAAGLGVASGVDVRPEVLGVVIGEQGPDEGGRAREPHPFIVRPHICRDIILGEEPAESGVVDFAEERSHRAVIARRAGRGQANPPRAPAGGGKSPGPCPSFSCLLAADKAGFISGYPGPKPPKTRVKSVSLPDGDNCGYWMPARTGNQAAMWPSAPASLAWSGSLAF